ncbi:hypothetical protein FOZ63_033906, partial [Perkinsus olseni]
EYESEYPYTAEDGACKTSLGNAVFKKALTTGPVSVSPRGSAFNFKHFGSDILTGDCDGPINDSVLAVGYGIENGIKKVKWVTLDGFGKGGSMALMVLFLDASCSGQCGILYHGAYPTLEHVL